MPKSNCPICGAVHQWRWEEAFDKFGFGDGNGDVQTATVVSVLRQAGYLAVSNRWGLHNDVIDTISKSGFPQIPSTARLGYDDPRQYLPKAIVALLDERLGVDADLTKGSAR